MGAAVKRESDAQCSCALCQFTCAAKQPIVTASATKQSMDCHAFVTASPLVGVAVAITITTRHCESAGRGSLFIKRPCAA